MAKVKVTEAGIVRAAEKLFSQSNYQLVSLREIALAVGVTKAALFYHFVNKRALYEAILRQRYEKFRAAFQRSAHNASLEQAIKIYLKFNSKLSLRRLLQQQFQDSQLKELAAKLEEKIQEVFQPLLANVRQGKNALLSSANFSRLLLNLLDSALEKRKEGTGSLKSLARQIVLMVS